MKNFKNTFLVLFLIGTMISTSSANPPRVAKAKARATLFRTQKVIFIARTSLKKNKVFTGHFKKAIIHQRYARIMFRRGRYWKAMVHSRYARRLARIVIQKNKGNVPANLKDTAEEDKIIGNAPSDSSLEEEANKEITESISEEELAEMEDLGITID